MVFQAKSGDYTAGLSTVMKSVNLRFLGGSASPLLRDLV